MLMKGRTRSANDCQYQVALYVLRSQDVCLHDVIVRQWAVHIFNNRLCVESVFSFFVFIRFRTEGSMFYLSVYVTSTLFNTPERRFVEQRGVSEE